MALQAKERLAAFQQRRIRGPVRHMAIVAVFGDIRVLKHKRPLNFHMTTSAGFFWRDSPQQVVLRRAMGVMTVDTSDFALGDRVMRELLKGRPDIRMTFETQFGHFFTTDFLLWPLVQFMAIEATDIIVGVSAGIPVSQYWSGGCGMTLEADQGLSLRRQLLKLKKRFELAFVLFRLANPFYCQTSGTMAGFAVHQREFGIRGNLFSVYRQLKIFSNLFVFMAFAQTIFIAHVVGVKAADDQLLVFTNRMDLVVTAKLLQVGTGHECEQAEE